jgi:hypothetical protein
VVAEDKRGGQWAFLVESVHQPAAIDVAKLFLGLDRITEINGQFVEIQSSILDPFRSPATIPRFAELRAEPSGTR